MTDQFDGPPKDRLPRFQMVGVVIDGSAGTGLFAGPLDEAIHSRAAITVATPNGMDIENTLVFDSDGDGIVVVDTEATTNVVGSSSISNKGHGMVVRPRRRGKLLFKP